MEGEEANSDERAGQGVQPEPKQEESLSSTPSTTRTRTSKPGIKRLCIVLSILLSFLAGLPFWLKSTEIYRASLPFSSIQEQTARVMSSSLAFPCYFHLIFTEQRSVGISDEALMQVLEETTSRLSKLLLDSHNFSFGGCGSLFTVMASLDGREKCLRVGVPTGVEVWPCGLMQSGLVDLVGKSNDDAIDDFLSNYSHGSTMTENGTWGLPSSGMYTILILSHLFFDNEKAKHPETELGDVAEPLPSQLKAVIGKYRHAWIVGCDVGIHATDAELLLSSDIVGKFFMNGGGDERQNKLSVEERGEAMPLAADGKAILSFSLLNAEPNDWIFDWDFDSLEKQFLFPVVNALKPVAHLTVESQVLYYTPNAVRSFWDSQLRMHIIHSNDLPFFVNANEWHLDTSSAAAGRSKLLHFAIYVPAARECPLQLKISDGSLSKTNGFTSPGWGGVTIFNPPMCSNSPNDTARRLSVKDLEPVMQVIVAQLRVLLGLPPMFPKTPDQRISCIVAMQTGFSEWELDVLLRRRATADMSSFASTLRSLTHLVQSLPNMVIKEEIGSQVRSSLLAAAVAEENTLKGFYDGAAGAARKARSWAEEAFFQPSIMSLLYLPLEHHFAIYTPFFVPVLLHTVLAALKEVKRYRAERRCFMAASS